ncbi:MAG: hypothetical protein FJW23_07550 [Acidimicrobiia bacterium]|nr:hypothetical protein [Acidimicrobiia bacterium]
MRTITLVFAVSLASVASTSAQAQGQPGASAAGQPSSTALRVPTGSLDFGVRGTTSTGDEARYQRYRELRSGPVLDRVRWGRTTETGLFTVALDHVGYRDQRYLAELQRFDRFTLEVDWDSVPLFYGAGTRTPYAEAGAGILRLPDDLQLAIQGGRSTIVDAARGGAVFDLRQRRDTGGGRFSHNLSSDAFVHVRVTTTSKTGEQPWGAPFGFSAANEVALPLDSRTNDVSAGLEWSNERALLRVAYDGSFFGNDVQTLVFDNALRATDTTSGSAHVAGNGTSQGQMAIWPGSSANAVSGLASFGLPGRSRAHAYVSVGSWSQNEPLLPFTVNTALPAAVLDRPTADAEARILATNLGVTSRPANDLWLSARYRLYDFDNRTPHFAVDTYARMDQLLVTSALGGSEPFGYTRNFVDLDASYTPLPHVAFRAGWSLEHDDRSFRFVEQTTEHTLRGSIDSTGLSRWSVRGLYEYARRTGTGFDEEAFSDIGEQVSLRQFDISDRLRHRVSAIVQVLPADSVGLTAQVGLGDEQRPDALLGLQENDFRFFTVGVDVTPGDEVMAGLSYGREVYASLQRSRQANPGPQFDDPTRDWSTDADEHVDTMTAYVDLPHVAERTALSFGYDYSRSRAEYLYLLASNSTLGAVDQLRPVLNDLHHGQVEARYRLTPRVSLGVTYWYDRYSVEDFAYDGLSAPFAYAGSGLFLGYGYRDYTAHTGWVRLILDW